MYITACLLLGGGCLTLAIVNITDPLGPTAILFGILVSLPAIYKDVKARGFGPRLIWAAFGALIVPAAAHAALNPTTGNIFGLAVFCSFPLLYLAARAHPHAMLAFPVFAIIESIGILCTLTHEPHASAGAFASIAHFSSIIILLGIFTAPKWLKWPLYLLGPAAILVTGSEEGLLLLGVAALAVIVRRDFQRYTLAALVSIIITLAIIVPTGHFADTHPNLTGHRLESLGDATNHRSTGVSDQIGTSWVLGTGWEYNTDGGRHQTLHNIYFKMMSQYGVLAALGLLIIMLTGLKTPLVYCFILFLAAGFVDHYLVTYFMPWPFLASGAGFYGQPMTGQRDTPAFSAGHIQKTAERYQIS